MQIEQTEVLISTPDGQMPAFLVKPGKGDRHPAILLLMESFGLTSHIQQVAIRIAHEGYVVLTPDLYYRQLPHNKFGYDEVDQAMAMMWSLDFGHPMEEDISAALNYLKFCSQVYPDQIGVTGFCLGGGLTFFTACKFSEAIAAAAPFYGMVLDEWVEAIPDITVPMYLFFGGTDPFIPHERIRQIESRFQELGKTYQLKIYPEANHGFFCHERSSYNRAAAEDSWQKLIQFFRQHLLLRSLD
ncbi:MAG: dienelactone hydrolase family protein [Leptolyngbyaceae cyanobacterium SL_5_9]|nr:dienelactone hydrolase family protein [Leptolyngbyaceae cyanobacterium SL_5_9]NJO73298.1 dienelactone hydrolase family protein [Leptolyngbyaceae cyanobacterium RM1_406_9]